MPTLNTEEEHYQKIRYWNKIYRACLLTLVFIAAAGVLFSAFKVNENTKQSNEILKNIIQCNTVSCKANKARQKNLEDYFKCLAVLKFDVPTAELQTREGVIKALDSCAQH